MGGNTPASEGGPAKVAETTRVKIELAYDGTAFSGWAKQPGLRTVEGCLDDAVALVAREPVRAVVAGRTDAGVHARGQVIHADLSANAVTKVIGRADRPLGAALVRRLAGALWAVGAGDIAVRTAAVAPSGFDARFGALWRRYSYRVADRAEQADPLRRHDTVTVREPLDVEKMNAAAAPLVGRHDFLSFCKPRDGATMVRTLLGLGFTRADDGVIVADIKADAFCHHMVRALIGSLLAVGSGRDDVDEPAYELARAGRDFAMHVAPAHGLCLEHVAYPADEALPARVATTRARRA